MTEDNKTKTLLVLSKEAYMRLENGKNLPSNGRIMLFTDGTGLMQFSDHPRGHNISTTGIVAWRDVEGDHLMEVIDLRKSPEGGDLIFKFSLQQFEASAIAHNRP